MKNRKTENIGYNLVKERVAKQLAKNHAKEVNTWKHINGKLHRLSKFVYWVTSILTLLTVALNSIIIYFAASSNYKSGQSDFTTFFRNNIYIVAALFISYVVSMIFQKTKRPVRSSIAIFVGTLFLLIQHFQIFQGGYRNQTRLVRYYFPGWILFIAALIIFIIVISDRKELNKELNREITKIYNHFSESEDEILMTQDDWDKLLIKYEEQKLYKQKNIKKAKKALNDAVTKDIEAETE